MFQFASSRRFAARQSGRAFGLARVNGPLGWQAPGSRVCPEGRDQRERP
jgi:hypothetical protein